jgi:hypothetical protein
MSAAPGLPSKTRRTRGTREKASKTQAMWRSGPSNCFTTLTSIILV